MPLELKKVTPTRLRLLGLDERWLQVRIEEDPSLLGLDDINVVRREKSQPSACCGLSRTRNWATARHL
jgi:hypothetical protein